MLRRRALRVSVGQPSDSRRAAAERLQLYLPRNSFSQISGALDMATGDLLAAPAGRLLADYMVLLEAQPCRLTPETPPGCRTRSRQWWRAVSPRRPIRRPGHRNRSTLR